MKEVNLIKFNTENIMVDDMRNCMDIHSFDNPINEIVGSQEYVPQFVDIDNIRIERIVDHGVEHYIAVSKKVWEYLYLIENPVTAESQARKILILKTEKDVINSKLHNATKSLLALSAKVYQASLFTRIKWVFTGIW